MNSERLIIVASTIISLVAILSVTGNQTTFAQVSNFKCAGCTHDQLLSTWVSSFQDRAMVPVIIVFKDQPTIDEIKTKMATGSSGRIDIKSEMALLKSHGGNISRTFDIVNAIAVNLPKDKIDMLKNNPVIASIDPDITSKITDIGADTQIRANQVWPIGFTGSGVPVAILDTGIDTTHPEFSGRIVQCHSEITGTNTCQDGNGHGSHVAGIIGAAGIDASAKGVAPAASFYIDQVLDSTGSGTLSQLINGINWAASNHVKIISMSLGLSGTDTQGQNCDLTIQSLTTAISNAHSLGITLVAAAGNDGSSGVSAPGCISNTIVVGAVDNTDTIASFSSRGVALSDHGLVAPGVNIYSAWLNHGYNTISGTSMATPMVTGVIALMLQKTPNLDSGTLSYILLHTTCKNGQVPSCPTIPSTADSNYGNGRVDALKAYTPSTSVTPSSGKVGSTANVGGFGYKSGNVVTITYDGAHQATTTATSTYTFVTSYTIPPSSFGPHTIMATDGISTASTTYSINGPSISSVNPNSGPAGEWVIITGYGFAASSTITVNYDGFNPVTTSSDSTGTITVGYTIPSSTQGQHTILATDQQHFASSVYTVIPCQAPTALTDWYIASSCTISSSQTAPQNMIVQPNTVLTIPNGVTLKVHFGSSHLLVNPGGKVSIQPGGKLSS